MRDFTPNGGFLQSWWKFWKLFCCFCWWIQARLENKTKTRVFLFSLQWQTWERNHNPTSPFCSCFCSLTCVRWTHLFNFSVFLTPLLHSPSLSLSSLSFFSPSDSLPPSLFLTELKSDQKTLQSFPFRKKSWFIFREFASEENLVYICTPSAS